MTITVQVTTASGNTFETRINADINRARQYYLNEVVHIIAEDDITGLDVLDRITKVTELLPK